MGVELRKWPKPDGTCLRGYRTQDDPQLDGKTPAGCVAVSMDMKKSVGLHENTAMDDDIDVKSNLKALATGRLGLDEAVSIVALSDAKKRVENKAADTAAAEALGGGIDVDMSENGDGNAGDEDMFESHADDSEPPTKARRVGDKGKAA